MNYLKPHLPLSDQISRLQTRGMYIPNPVIAKHYLSHLNYYRLRAYWFPFEQDHKTHQFKPNVSLDTVLNVYYFDQALRLLLLDAIARIEISIRTQWAYHLSKTTGPFGYLDAALNKNQNWLRNDKQALKRELGRSNELFIKHFAAKYRSEPFPPIWMACEVISFGLFSRWYTNLKSTPVRAAIAHTYGMDKNVLPNVVRHLVHVRNICAHHGRIWNKKMVVSMPLPKSKPPGLAANMNPQQDRKLYNTLVMLIHLGAVVEPDNDWAARLTALLEKYQANTFAMGFPIDWRKRPLWQKTIR